MVQTGDAWYRFVTVCTPNGRSEVRYRPNGGGRITVGSRRPERRVTASSLRGDAVPGVRSAESRTRPDLAWSGDLDQSHPQVEIGRCGTAGAHRGGSPPGGEPRSEEVAVLRDLPLGEVERVPLPHLALDGAVPVRRRRPFEADPVLVEALVARNTRNRAYLAARRGFLAQRDHERLTVPRRHASGRRRENTEVMSGTPSRRWPGGLVTRPTTAAEGRRHTRLTGPHAGRGPDLARSPSPARSEGSRS